MAAYLWDLADFEDIAAAIVIAAFAIRRRRVPVRSIPARSIPVHKQRKRKATLPHILKREVYGAFHCLVQELASEDPGEMRQFIPMSANTCDELLRLVAPLITKADTSYKDSIPAEERLALTLRHLASGGPYSNLLKLFQIPVSTTSYMIPETCDAIFNALKEKYLKFPSTVQEFQQIQDRFFDQWNFPQCFGVLDGKHIRIQCPQKNGFLYQNYLNFHSVVLLALIDADYKFLYYEVGTPGGNDGTVWSQSVLKAGLDSNTLTLPDPAKLPGSDLVLPSLIVADSAFQMSLKVVNVYSSENLTEEQKVFNYHLCRVRQVAENTFGLLASRFAVYKTPMKIEPPRIKSILLATLALHNFLRDCRDERYVTAGDVNWEQGDGHGMAYGEWGQNPKPSLAGLQPNINNEDGHHASSGEETRDTLKCFFNRAGAVHWQTAGCDHHVLSSFC